jgi:hypothetical protein
MAKQPKPIRKTKTNKGKKYEKPLSLYGMKFEQLLDIGLKNKPAD